jgi:hypothetical protein
MSQNKAAVEAANKTAGLFDIRNVIGGLLAVYGVILLLMGIFGDKESDKTGDINANLWSGLVLAIVGAIFLVWAKVRPVVVDEEVVEEARRED